VNLELPDIAVEFGATATRAFDDAGGVELARRAETGPEIRASLIGPLLDELGARGLDLDDPDVAVAAGELCRAAGRVVLPYPVVGLLASGERTRRPTAVIDPKLPRVDHGDLFPAWQLVSIEGDVWEGAAKGRRLGTKLGPFVTDMRISPADHQPDDLPMTLTLEGWRILGTLEQALETTAAHVTARHQFGRPLAAFQAVQFQVADATVAVQALRELAHFTMWRLFVAPLDRLVDALALRVHALESASYVLRVCHQLHGAIGFCDEHDLSILTRHVQPQLRLPVGLEATTEHLIAAVEDSGFDSLFSKGSTPLAVHRS
jgi:hypothetical protein